MRYENVQDDFSKALQLIGIEQKQPLPVVNKTREKKILDYIIHLKFKNMLKGYSVLS